MEPLVALLSESFLSILSRAAAQQIAEHKVHEIIMPAVFKGMHSGEVLHCSVDPALALRIKRPSFVVGLVILVVMSLKRQEVL